jgi:hypothetical protein
VPNNWARECPEEDHRNDKLPTTKADPQEEPKEDVDAESVNDQQPLKKRGGGKKKKAFRVRAESYDDSTTFLVSLPTLPKHWLTWTRA